MKRILQNIFIITIAIGVIYLITKIATRPVIIPETDHDPTGKIWMEKQIELEKEYLREEDGKKGLWILNEILNINKERLSKTDLENGYKITRRIEKRI